MSRSLGPKLPRRGLRAVFLLTGAVVLSWLAWDTLRLPALYGTDVTGPPFVRSPGTKYILLWNNYFHFPNLGYGPGSGYDAFRASGCPQSNCFMTKDRSLMPAEEFDAVVLHMYYFTMRITWFLNRGMLPSSRSDAQRYIFFLLESPATCGSKYKNLQHVFNWTMTYRSDSDIVAPYGVVEPRAGAEVPVRGWLEPPAPPISPAEAAAAAASAFVPRNRTIGWPTGALQRVARSRRGSDKKRPALVAWLVSHCSTESRREEYVARLSMHMEVDVYGACGTPWPGPKGDVTSFHKMLNEKYKFYLSFENSLCKDYVTEKLFDILLLDVVPIVYGGANYSAVAPPHSFIDARSFESPRHLAAYLQYLASHPDEYEKFFWWKRYYVARRHPHSSVCRLCAMLHEDQPRKSYSDMEQWWRGGDTCQSPDVSLGDLAEW